MRVLTHAPGPREHGVVRHAAAVQRLVRARGVAVTGAPVLTHAQFTDSLYGPDIDSSARAFQRWAETAVRPLVVTLHDVPGGDPDPARDARRSAGYRRVVRASDVVVVSSDHEAGKIARIAGCAPTVIDLPLGRPVAGAPRPAWADRPSVGVLGFVHPGKGLDVAVRVAARHGLRAVVAGAVSPGHDAVLDELRGQAELLGVDLVATGHLSDAAMTAAARSITIPLVSSSTVSASGSLMTWLGCGRRPIAVSGVYAVEMARRRPGVLHLAGGPAGDLDRAVEGALRDPSSTWLAGRQLWPDTGAEHVALYRRALARC